MEYGIHTSCGEEDLKYLQIYSLSTDIMASFFKICLKKIQATNDFI